MRIFTPGASFVVNGTALAFDSARVTGAAEMQWIKGWATAGPPSNSAGVKLSA